MHIDEMDGSFRQADVALHFVLGLLSWSRSLGHVIGPLQPGAASVQALSERGLTEPEPTGDALHLILGLMSFDRTLHAALERAAVAVAQPQQVPSVQQSFENFDLGR